MDINSILDRIVTTLKDIRGISAIVLGGSRVTGTATEHSDIDIAVYYDSTFDLASFKAAAQLDDEHRADCITDLGEWGPWINGGGWLTIDGIAVDILFKDLAKISACLQDCIDGKLTIDYQCGHPFGFINAIYAGEVRYCQILYAADDALSRLKAKLDVFPSKYKQAAIERFLWECEFSLMCGQKGLKKNDIVYVTGSLFRCAICLIQVMYAYNELYCLNEKSSLQILRNSPVVLPTDFCDRLENTMLINSADLEESFVKMEKLLAEVKAICQ